MPYFSTRLAEILRHEATLLDHIINDQRYYPDYFRVAFWGEFPDALRGKHFIVRDSFCSSGCELMSVPSTGGTSGNGMVHSASGCLTNIRVPNC